MNVSLFIKGRNIKEKALPIRFDPDNGIWSMNDKVEEDMMSTACAAILAIICNLRCKPKEIAIILGTNPSTTPVNIGIIKERGFIDENPYGLHFEVINEIPVNILTGINKIINGNKAA